MKFLITNDDGFDGPGLAALHDALRPLGEVRVVAPAVCHSAKGHAVNTHSPIQVERRTVPPYGEIEIVDSSPADCVRIGLCAPGVDQPDFVIAGINTGANLGVDLFYSGTAAAARESAILGVPAMAVSRYLQPGVSINWQNLTGHVTAVVRKLISEDNRLQSGCFWNVNFPAIDDDQHPDSITFAPQGVLSHNIEFRTQPHGSDENITIMEYAGDFRARGKSGECDVTRLFAGQITATPIDLCTTAPHPKTPKS